MEVIGIVELLLEKSRFPWRKERSMGRYVYGSNFRRKMVEWAAALNSLDLTLYLSPSISNFYISGLLFIF